MRALTFRPLRTGAILAGALLLASCASPAASPEKAASSDPSAPAGESVHIEDAWVQAAESGMSAAFGALHNDGSAEATITAVASEASPTLELHETVEASSGQMQMREADGGLVLPSNGSLALEPGGNHIMLMDLAHPLKPGDEVTFTLTFSDASTYEFSAPVKDFAGANENYEGGEHSEPAH